MLLTVTPLAAASCSTSVQKSVTLLPCLPASELSLSSTEPVVSALFVLLTEPLLEPLLEPPFGVLLTLDTVAAQRAESSTTSSDSSVVSTSVDSTDDWVVATEFSVTTTEALVTDVLVSLAELKNGVGIAPPAAAAAVPAMSRVLPTMMAARLVMRVPNIEITFDDVAAATGATAAPVTAAENISNAAAMPASSPSAAG